MAELKQGDLLRVNGDLVKLDVPATSGGGDTSMPVRYWQPVTAFAGEMLHNDTKYDMPVSITSTITKAVSQSETLQLAVSNMPASLNLITLSAASTPSVVGNKVSVFGVIPSDAYYEFDGPSAVSQISILALRPMPLK